MSHSSAPETEEDAGALPPRPTKPSAPRRWLTGARTFWHEQAAPPLNLLWAQFKRWIAVAGIGLLVGAIAMIDIGEYAAAVGMLALAFVAFGVQIWNAPSIPAHLTATKVLKGIGYSLCLSVVSYFVGVAYLKAQSSSWSTLLPRNKPASIMQNPAPTPLTIAVPSPQPTATATPTTTPTPAQSPTPSPTPSPTASPTPSPKPTRVQPSEAERERLRQEALKALNINKRSESRP